MSGPDVLEAEGPYVRHSSKEVGLIPFQPRRLSQGTRLTICELHTHDEGVYVVYNVGDSLHIAPYDATEKEPIRTMVFNPSAVRDGYPCCHAFCTNARDSADLLVGIANGEVHLMSLRAQLQPAPAGAKPAIIATLNADNVHDASRLHAVAWVPASEGSQFLAAHASGAILVYRKSNSMVGESGSGSGSGGSKFLPHLGGGKGGGLSPVQTLQLGAGPVLDVAFNPAGTKLAAACRDGTLRVLDWPGGACSGGFHSFYGALLCCCWSGDGRFIAAGGEDDLVTWYCVADRSQIAWGEGHTSFVGRVAFDTHWEPPEPASTAGADPGLLCTSYRIGSAGQDACLALWDLTVEEEAGPPGSGAGGGGIKRVASASVLSVPTVSSAANLAMLGAEGGGGGHHHARQPSASNSGALAGDHGSSMGGGLNRQGSGRLPVSGSGPPLAPAVDQRDMQLLRPVMLSRLHSEPLSDIVFTEEAIFTACYGGGIKCWLRPRFSADSEPGTAAAAAAPPPQ